MQIDDRLTAAERANRIKVLQEGLTKTQTAPAERSQSENDDEEKEAGKKAIDPREPVVALRWLSLQKLKKGSGYSSNRNGTAGN